MVSLLPVTAIPGTLCRFPYIIEHEALRTMDTPNQADMSSEISEEENITGIFC
jgi:hypothetical protein